MNGSTYTAQEFLFEHHIDDAPNVIAPLAKTRNTKISQTKP